MSTIDKIKQLLTEKFNAPHIEILDESYHHSTHPEALRGGGHYHVLLVSDRFKDLKTIERHRLVYQTLKSLFAREIHAFTIQALTAGEWAKKGHANLDLGRFSRTYLKPDSKTEICYVIFVIFFLLVGGIMFVLSK